LLDRGWPHSLVCGSLLPIAPVERCGLLQRVRCYSPAASRSRTFSHYSGLLVRVCAPTGLCVARARPCWGRWSLRSLQLCETLFLTSPPIISYSPPPPPTRDGRTQHSGSEPCGDGKAAQQARPAPRGAPHVCGGSGLGLYGMSIGSLARRAHTTSTSPEMRGALWPWAWPHDLRRTTGDSREASTQTITHTRFLSILHRGRLHPFGWAALLIGMAGRKSSGSRAYR